MAVVQSSNSVFGQKWETTVQAVTKLSMLCGKEIRLLDVEQCQFVLFNNQGQQISALPLDKDSPQPERLTYLSGHRPEWIFQPLDRPEQRFFALGREDDRIGVVFQESSGLSEDHRETILGLLYATASTDTSRRSLRSALTREHEYLRQLICVVEQMWQSVKEDDGTDRPEIERMTESLLSEIIGHTSFERGAIYIDPTTEPGNQFLITHPADMKPCLQSPDVLSQINDFLIQDRRENTLFQLNIPCQSDVPCQTGQNNHRVVLTTLRPPANGPIGTLILFLSDKLVETKHTDLEIATARLMGLVGAGMIAATLYHQERGINRAKDIFLNHVTHELRTPVCRVKDGAEMLLRPNYGPLSEVQRELMNTIESSAQISLSLIDSILTFARIKAEQSHCLPTELDAQELISLICREFYWELQNKNITLIQATEPENVLLWADEKLVKTALRNLIGNAIKYTSEGGEIRVTAEQMSNCTVLTVADTGIGIEQEHQDRIFDSFYRVQAVDRSSTPGMGLGLSLVKQLMDLHKGTISLTSVPDKGTTFRLHFPLPDHDAD